MREFDSTTLYAVSLIATGQSLRAVAQSMHVSQPALSTRLQILEHRLGFQLFTRESGRLKLSDRGRRFMPHVYAFLDQSAALRKAAQRVQRDLRDTWRLGMTPIAAITCGVRVMQCLQDSHPEANFMFIERTSNELEYMLVNDDLNFAVLHPPLNLAGLEMTALFDEPYQIAIPEQHALAAQNTISVIELASETFAMVAREVGPHLYDRLIALCRHSGFEPRIAWTLPTSLALPQFVAKTGCVGFLLRSMAPLAVCGMVMRPLVETPPTLGFAACRRSSDMSSPYDALVDDFATQRINRKR